MKKYLKLLRVNQWIKNIFIFLPFFFDGTKIDFLIWINLLIGFLAFSCVTSAIYVLNDIIDREDDENHPIKKHRPIAAKEITLKHAGLIGILIGSISLTYFFIFEHDAVLFVIIYITIMILYCFFFRKISILDVLVISIGFVLRLFIGGKISDTPISVWIIIMVFLLALFIAFSKRRDDLINGNSRSRKSLLDYNLTFINTVISILVPIIIVTYILYCTSDSNILRVSKHIYLTTLFVIMGFLRYLQIVFVNKLGGDPVQIVYDDFALKTIVLSWMATFGYLLYL